MRGVDPQRRCQCGTGAMHHVNQLITGILLKLRIINLLPHPEILNGGIASHPALNEIAGTGSVLPSGNFRHRDIGGDPHILGPHLVSKRGWEKSRNLFGIQLLKQFF